MGNPAGSAFTDDELRDLIRSVGGATKPQKVHIKCKSCQRSYDYTVDFPDKRVMLDAAKFAHENGYGKASQAKDSQDTINLDIDVTTYSSDARAQCRRDLLRRYPDLAPVFASITP